MKKALIITLLFHLFFQANAQEDWGEPIVIDFPKLSQLSLDNQGFIFIADSEGNIYQFDRQGKEINNFSPHRQGAISHLEASWTVNIFAFSQDLQEYRILDRFIIPISENRIPLTHFNVVKVATLGNNNIIWVFDETDLSLKQWDYRRNRIFQDQPLNLILERSTFAITDMREYQNLLFLNIEEEGIYILDNQGNLIKRIPQTIEQSLSFYKTNLFFLDKKDLVLMNFQTGKSHRFQIPETLSGYHVVMNQYQVIFYNEKRVVLYAKDLTPLNDT